MSLTVYLLFIARSSFPIRTMASSKLSRSNPSFYLPGDLIIDILSRLPVKSLIRFAVVCKAWYALIQNPDFISRHLKQSMENPNLNLSSLLVLSRCYDTLTYSMLSYSENSLDKPNSLDFLFMREIYHIAVVGVCNGLVCVSLCKDDLNLVICNPATMKFHKLPDCKFWDEDCIEYGETLLGFGFDPSSNEFKLIKITRYENQDKEYVKHAEIYTMSTNSWRENDTKIPFSKFDETRVPIASAIINGVFYWEGQDSRSGEAAIWSFDMNDEMYWEIDVPERYKGEWSELTWEIIQLKEELAMFVSTSKRCYSVWVLNLNEICWNEKFKIGPFPTIERPMQVGDISDINVAGLGKDGGLIVKDNAILDDVKFFSYNLRSQEIKILPFTDRMYYFRVFWYTESLLPVNKSDQAQEG